MLSALFAFQQPKTSQDGKTEPQRMEEEEEERIRQETPLDKESIDAFTETLMPGMREVRSVGEGGRFVTNKVGGGGGLSCEVGEPPTRARWGGGGGVAVCY